MTREEIRNKIFEEFKRQVKWVEINPNQIQQYQMSFDSLFPYDQNQPQWERNKLTSMAHEVLQELISAGFIYQGKADDQSGWLTVTQHGKEAFESEDWLPYDPEG